MRQIWTTFLWKFHSLYWLFWIGLACTGTVFKRRFSCISYTFFSKRNITYYRGYTFENQDLKGFAYICNFPILKYTHFLVKTFMKPLIIEYRYLLVQLYEMFSMCSFSLKPRTFTCFFIVLRQYDYQHTIQRL